MTTIKAIFGLLLAAAAAGVLGVASSAGDSGSARSGALHVTKECSEFHGSVGEFCTITSSNIRAIEPGMKVFYLAAPANGMLDSDIALSSGHGGAAVGHVVLDLSTKQGGVRFSAGTGRFAGFHARVVVSLDRSTGLWHWDGTYRFNDRNDA